MSVVCVLVIFVEYSMFYLLCAMQFLRSSPTKGDFEA